MRRRVPALVMAITLALAGCGTGADAPTDDAIDEPPASIPTTEVEPGPAEPPPTVAGVTECEAPGEPTCGAQGEPRERPNQPPSSRP